MTGNKDIQMERLQSLMVHASIIPSSLLLLLWLLLAPSCFGHFIAIWLVSITTGQHLMA